MDADEFKRRTKAFALRVIRLVDSLPTSRRADVFARQLLRAGTAVGASDLMSEADAILAMVVTSIRTARPRR